MVGMRVWLGVVNQPRRHVGRVEGASVRGFGHVRFGSGLLSTALASLPRVYTTPACLPRVGSCGLVEGWCGGRVQGFALGFSWLAEGLFWVGGWLELGSVS